MTTIKKIRKLAAAIGVSVIAFFELCFTGKAVGAWRIARSGDGLKILYNVAGTKVTPAEHPPTRLRNYLKPGAATYGHSSPLGPAPIYLSRLIIVIAVAVLVITAVLLSVERPDGQQFHQLLEDGVVNGASIKTASGMATEGQSSTGRAERLGGVVCVVLSIAMVTGAIYINRKKPERKLDHK